MKPIRHLALVLTLWLTSTALNYPAKLSAAEHPRPNVIVILSDDLGSIDEHCYGATDLVTPAVDSLAQHGVRFTQFYSAAPVCSPSRAGLLTGRYPWLVGLPNNAPSPPTEADDQLNTFTGAGLATNAATMADMFRAAGYATAHIGKWHLGYSVGHRPLDHGFDYSFGFMDGCIDNYSHFFYWDGANRHDLWENNQRVRMPGRYFPDLMIEKSEAFIQAHKNGPFFMYFAINMPHYPYQGDPKWLEYYKKRSALFPRNLYAAFVDTLDERIGRLLQFVADQGLRDNTIIVYQSDNGHSTEIRAHGGGGNSGPYRGAKFSMFEGGIRLPAIISWPGHLPEGAVRTQVAHSCDWLPTLAALCDVPMPNAKLDGRSLVPVIQSATAPSPNDVLHWMVGKQWAVRQGDWKLLHAPIDPTSDKKINLADGQWFLANIANDPGERTNLAAQYPDIVKRLRAFAPTKTQ